MKLQHLISLLLALVLAGCATKRPKTPVYSAPVGAEKISGSIGKAQTGLAQIDTATVKAKATAEKIRPHVATAGQPLVDELEKNLDESNKARMETSESLAAALRDVGEYQTKVEEQTSRINDLSDAYGKKQEEVLYWQGKQSKSLKEIWIWRSIAAASVCAVGVWLGLKSGWKFFL